MRFYATEEMDPVVPADLKKLVKFVIYSFYSSQHIAIINLLTYYRILDEDTFIELLQVDKKSFRSAIVPLRNDRLIKQTIKKEKDTLTNQTNTYIFYHINYISFLNIVRFKLDRIRKQLFKEERCEVNMSSYCCTGCGTSYTEVDIPRMINMDDGEILCKICDGNVIESIVETQQKSNKSQVAKYNEQFEPFFTLVEQCMECVVTPDLLDPEITVNHMTRAAFSRTNQGVAANHVRTENLSKSTTNSILVDTQSVDVNLSSQTTDSLASKSKPLPDWLEVRKYQPEQQSPVKRKLPQNSLLKQTPEETPQVMKDIVMFETHQEPDKLSSTDLSDDYHDLDPFELGNVSEKDVLSSPSVLISDFITDDTIRSQGTFELDNQDVPRFVIGNTEYTIDEVTEEITKKMTEGEHEKYIKSINELYKSSF